MRKLLFALGILALCGCRPASVGRLPEVGAIVFDRDSGYRYRVTWSGNTTYNQGGCPEINTLCVHLVSAANGGLLVGAETQPAELAVTLKDFRSRFRQPGT